LCRPKELSVFAAELSPPHFPSTKAIATSKPWVDIILYRIEHDGACINAAKGRPAAPVAMDRTLRCIGGPYSACNSAGLAPRTSTVLASHHHLTPAVPPPPPPSSSSQPGGCPQKEEPGKHCEHKYGDRCRSLRGVQHTAQAGQCDLPGRRERTHYRFQVLGFFGLCPVAMPPGSGVQKAPVLPL